MSAAPVRNDAKRTIIPRSEHPHRFRTRNDLNKAQQARSKANENTAKSMKLTDLLPLITVWLQVRVLPGPPAINHLSGFHFACRRGTAPDTHRFAAYWFRF